VKGIGIGILRWLVGLVFGLVSAALLFGLAARVAASSGADAAVGPLALLGMGFGIAFFPVIYTMGTRSPRQVARRGFVGLAIEGLIAVVLVAYQAIVRSAPVPASGLAWIDWVDGAARDLAGLFTSDLLVGALGLVIFAFGLILFLALRIPATASREVAPARPPAARPEVTTSRPPAAGQARPATTPDASATRPVSPPAVGKAADDEDAQLLADLENLRKKLPKMGVDEPGTGERS
jgi:hypothetical protein